MKILNLGCGTKVSSRTEVINVDQSIYLRIKKNPLLRVVSPLLLQGERLARFNAVPANCIVHNLTKEFPFASNSIDVVYHSHVLEHLDREIARRFLLEVKRVLTAGGIQRIVVPDLEKACRSYISHVAMCEKNPEETGQHDRYVAAIIAQSVRREATGTSQQKPIRRFLENALLGDARRQGETHQWMYDCVSLTALLVDLGYKNITRQHFNTSSVPDWNQYGLDLDGHGDEYKPESLYMEAQK